MRSHAYIRLRFHYVGVRHQEENGTPASCDEYNTVRALLVVRRMPIAEFADRALLYPAAPPRGVTDDIVRPDGVASKRQTPAPPITTPPASIVS